MNGFLQLHLLTNYHPGNPNRDDLGRPKTAIIGGVTRLRISSQSQKRAWRTSSVFGAIGEDKIGERTRRLGERVFKRLLEGGVDMKKAADWSQLIAGQFAKVTVDKKATTQEQLTKALYSEQITHVSPAENARVMKLAATLAEEKRKPTTDELELLGNDGSGVDIALFGRMIAASPGDNVEAAAQVAHAFSVHGVTVEDDYFSAVDDLNDGSEDAGAGHIGETQFASGLMYHYICIDRRLLANNLANPEHARAGLRAFIEATCTVTPTGKQNSFATRAFASFAMAEKGEGQPRSLAAAFLDPMNTRGEGTILARSCNALIACRDNFNRAYGAAPKPYSMNVSAGEGTLAELLDFCVSP